MPIKNHHTSTTARHYYPFGMPMPGLYGPANSIYRFGFNGKENDNEIKGFGNQQDYGMRIYDTRLARFLSVDPITKDYPELTPYQFASNRPIDGLDLDGLEYYTVHVKVHDGTGQSIIKVEDYTNMTDAQINEVHGMPSQKFYKRYSKSFGARGRGVLFVYHYYENDNEVGIKDIMQLEANITRHGIFYGSECITYTGLRKNFTPSNEIAAINYYDFSKDPIDEVDALAKVHDIRYASFTEGYEGWFNDERAIGADIEFVIGLSSYLKRATQAGYKDKYTDRAPSTEAIWAARFAKELFIYTAIDKSRRMGMNQKAAERKVKRQIRKSENAAEWNKAKKIMSGNWKLF